MKATRKFKDYALKHSKIRKAKKVKGFTLVELIVVIAIIGVLAVLLIPNMMGKVSQARLTTANDTAAKIAEQANIAAAELEASGDYQCGSEKFYYSADTTASTPKEITDTNKFGKALINSLGANYEGKFTIEFNSDATVKEVYYAKDAKTKYIGRYPNPTTLDDVSGQTINAIQSVHKSFS